VLVAVRQGQLRDAAATGEERLGRCSAGQSKYVWLYRNSGKLALAAMYLRRVQLCGGRSTTDACLYRWRLRHKTSAWASGGPAGGTKACGDMLEALARVAPSQPKEAMARIAPRSPMVPNKISLDTS
jgi:hypothetical protein